jgi:hypothetical protein
MSHKMIEKEIGWDEFITFLFTATVLQYEGYCFEISRVRLEKDNVVIYNGPCVRKDDNEIIKYGLGSFYVNQREYDEEAAGWLRVETYKLVEKEIKLHQLKLYA